MDPSIRSRYAALDRSEVSNVLFYPRAEGRRFAARTRGKDHFIAVAPDVHIGARFHISAAAAVNLLFFHGNGEIVADYDEVSSFYRHLGINFLPVDYRGYGVSSGRPTVGDMMADSHVIFDDVHKWLQANGYTGPLAVMGRSLGSACALELAAEHADRLDGLIIESGFAFAGPLLRLLGIDVDRIGFSEEEGFRNIDKIRKFKGPTLVIHAQFDHIIPISDGRVLYEASMAQRKRFVQIEGADHNNLFSLGLETYLQSVDEWVHHVRGSSIR